MQTALRNNNSLSLRKTLLNELEQFCKFNNKLGTGNILYGVDYLRCFEYPLAYQRLNLSNDLTNYLDVGTGKHSIFPLYIANNYPDITTRITDLGSYVFKQEKRINFHPTLKKLHKQAKVIIEKQDIRELTYQDNYFDRISAIATISHIADDGDTAAIKEIYRVLKPGGIMVISIPYRHQKYYVKYRYKSAYIYKFTGKPIFFSHYYNDEAIDKRLLSHINSDLIDISYIGEEQLGYYTFLQKNIPSRNLLKYFLGWTSQYMAKKCLTITTQKEKAHVAVITIKKR